MVILESGDSGQTPSHALRPYEKQPIGPKEVAAEWALRSQRSGLTRVMRASLDRRLDEPITDETISILESLLTHAHTFLGYRPGNVIEIGCGIGRLTRTIAQYADSVTAIDFTPKMVSVASAQVSETSKIRFEICRAQDFPWQSNVWDVTISVWVLMHILDDAELARLCAAVGRSSKLIIVGEYATAATPVSRFSRLRSLDEYVQLFGGGRILAQQTLDYDGDISSFALITGNLTAEKR